MRRNEIKKKEHSPIRRINTTGEIFHDRRTGDAHEYLEDKKKRADE